MKTILMALFLAAVLTGCTESGSDQTTQTGLFQTGESMDGMSNSEMHSDMDGKTGEHMQMHMMKMDSAMMDCHEQETADNSDDTEDTQDVAQDDHSDHH